jgi:hypothetical protein
MSRSNFNIVRRIEKLEKAFKIPKARTIPLDKSLINTDLRSKAERKAWKKQIESHKNRWVPPVRSAASDIFKRESKKVVSVYTSTGSLSATKSVISSFTPAWQSLLETTWRKVGKYAGKVVLKAHVNSLALEGKQVDLTVADLIDPAATWDRYVTKYFRSKTGLNKAKGIPEYSQLNVEAAIKRGIAEDETKAEISGRIAKIYDQASLGRASTIARTEVNAATNYASLETMKEDGGATTKIWNCLMDNSREWHIEADGQEVPIDEQFEVGGESVDCPGDGSDFNVVNCNCDLSYSTTPTEETPTGGG